MKAPNRESVWSSILTAAGTALFAVIGYLWIQVMAVQDDQLRTVESRFTDKDGQELKDFIREEINAIRTDLSQVTSDMDKRLAIMEVHVKYMTPIFQPDIHRFLHENGSDQYAARGRKGKSTMGDG